LRGKSIRRVRAAVLIADLRGFTRLSSRLEPEAAVTLFEEYLTMLADIAVAHQASIEHIVGDGVVLLFRPAGSRRDDSVRAVRTGLALQRGFLASRNRWLRETRPLAGRLTLAVGIATGELIVTDLLGGAPNHLATPMGEPLSRASRLCARARGAEVLVDQATFSGAHVALDREATFGAQDIVLRNRVLLAAYRAQARRAGLHVVSRGISFDPVCGARVAPRQASMRRVRDGETYYFCSRTCADHWDRDA
jgi:class 3 adenylate cyclase/YHS domain-containing protein